MAAPLEIAVKTTGEKDLVRLIKRYGDRGVDAFAGAAYMWATNVISTAMKLTPVFTGFLRDSRYVELPVVTGAGAFKIGMGFSAPYAVFVHEIHKRYIVGEWKFMETALNWHAPSAMREVAQWTKKLIETGGGIQSIGIRHPTQPLQGPIHQPSRKPKREKGESAKAYASRLKKHRTKVKKIAAQRANGRAANVLRIAAESQSSLSAQRAGRRPPRPGRGG